MPVYRITMIMGCGCSRNPSFHPFPRDAKRTAASLSATTVQLAHSQAGCPGCNRGHRRSTLGQNNVTWGLTLHRTLPCQNHPGQTAVPAARCKDNRLHNGTVQPYPSRDRDRGGLGPCTCVRTGAVRAFLKEGKHQQKEFMAQGFKE